MGNSEFVRAVCAGKSLALFLEDMLLIKTTHILELFSHQMGKKIGCLCVFPLQFKKQLCDFDRKNDLWRKG